MDYPPTKMDPWNHQKIFWNRYNENIACYAAFDMGAGKTKMAIDYANGISATKILVICPKRIIDHWPNQFNIHSFEDYDVCTLIKGSVTQKAEQASEFMEIGKLVKRRIVVVVNYESMWRPPLGPVYNDKNRITDIGILAKQNWDFLVCDEAHRIKSPGGAASWGLKRIAKSAKRRMWLSGTPMPHSPVDLYAQFRALAPWIFGTRLKAYKNEYCVLGGYNDKQVVAYKNLNRLHQKFFSITMHVDSKDVLELPDKQDIVIKCDLSPTAKKIYNQVDAAMVADIGRGKITAKNALVKLLRLQQLTGGTLTLDDDSIKFVDNNKIDTVVELLKDLPEKENVVIFCIFRPELQRLSEAILKDRLLKKTRRIGEISGRGIPPPPDFYDAIWHATDTNTLLVQIQAGGEGIDLTAARYCFYVSTGFNLGQYRQSRKRLHRPGQTRKVFYYHIAARGTIDVRVMRSIEKKEEIINYIIKDIKGVSTSNVANLNTFSKIK